MIRKPNMPNMFRACSGIPWAMIFAQHLQGLFNGHLLVILQLIEENAQDLAIDILRIDMPMESIIVNDVKCLAANRRRLDNQLVLIIN